MNFQIPFNHQIHGSEHQECRTLAPSLPQAQMHRPWVAIRLRSGKGGGQWTVTNISAWTSATRSSRPAGLPKGSTSTTASLPSTSNWTSTLLSHCFSNRFALLAATEPKRWGIGLQAGYGVALHNNQVFPAPYIGVGVSWNFFQF